MRTQQKKMKISVPADATEFLTMIKRYANLIYSVFSVTFTLFKLMQEVVRVLQEYSQEARKRMTLNTKGSMLWIILLQSRQFSLGEVNVLCEFTTMHKDLRAKRAAIHHSDMPLDLISNSA